MVSMAIMNMSMGSTEQTELRGSSRNFRRGRALSLKRGRTTPEIEGVDTRTVTRAEPYEGRNQDLLMSCIICIS